MTEIATLRKLRAVNSKLMKNNLALLTAIREIDCEIEDEWRALQQCCVQLEKYELAIPSSCLALMGTPEEATVGDNDNDSVEDKRIAEAREETGSSTEESSAKTPSTPSALSMSSMLNAEPSDENSNDSNSMEDSISEQGSTEDS